MLRIVGKTYEVPRNLLEKVAQAAFSFLKLEDAEIELKFVSKREISRLNDVYRNKKGPTDVLSFTLEEKPLLGQIFICYTFTREQAKSLKRNLEDEVALLLVHGILHVSGYDHEKVVDAHEMQRLEKEILDKAGVNK